MTILKWWEIKESPTVGWWLITVVTAAGLRFRYTIEQTIIQALKTQNEIKWGLYTGVLAFGESTARLFFPFISNKLNNKLMTTFISSAFSHCLKCYLTEQHQSHWCLAEESPSPKLFFEERMKSAELWNFTVCQKTFCLRGNRNDAKIIQAACMSAFKDEWYVIPFCPAASRCSALSKLLAPKLSLIV